MLGEARMTWFVDMAAMSDRVILNQESAAKYANPGMKPLPIKKKGKKSLPQSLTCQRYVSMHTHVQTNCTDQDAR
ncbi:hypothetical protein B7489_05605 [Vibrio alginolyticus]|nr:hypothetical protein B7489_05605 [Vibrio alginolyticus]